MGSFGQLQSIDSANGDEKSTSGLSELLWNEISLEQPTVPCSGESRFPIPLRVSGNDKPREELHRSTLSQSVATDTPDTASTSTSCMDDNFMFHMDSSYSDSILSMATKCDTITDPGEVSIPIKQGRKRKIDSETVNRMVRVNATFNESVKEFLFSTTGTLPDLENEVAKRFKLEGEELKLKYMDDENDLIWICLNIDLKLALDTAVSNNTINLICESVHDD